MDTDAKSYVQHNVEAVLSSAEHMNKMKYVDAFEARHATFTPFVVSVDGVLGREARMFVNHLGDSIADMWKKNPIVIRSEQRCPLLFIGQLIFVCVALEGNGGE